MKNALIIVLVLLVSACGKSESSRPAFESAEVLSANPERLKDLRAQCKSDHGKVGDAQCNAVAEATRRRFLGSGTPYTSAPPHQPSASAASAPSSRAS